MSGAGTSFRCAIWPACSKKPDARMSGLSSRAGNVIFTGGSSHLDSVITSKISERFGYRVPVILRTAQQLRDVVSNNPFLNAAGEEDTLHVMFLPDCPERGGDCRARSQSIFTGRVYRSRPGNLLCSCREWRGA